MYAFRKGSLSINSASNRNTRPRDLLHSSSKLLRHRPRFHNLSNFNNIVKRNVTVMLDVLRLLPVTLWFLQGLDNQRRHRWNNSYLGLTILNGELDGNPKTFPVLGSSRWVVLVKTWFGERRDWRLTECCVFVAHVVDGQRGWGDGTVEGLSPECVADGGIALWGGLCVWRTALKLDEVRR